MWLIVGDLHLTDRASDQYRFGIFDWMRRQQAKDVAATFLLGDLTNQKDHHSATLVNKIVAGLVSLKPPVYIDRGNHDYKANQANPFFHFLNHIEGLTFATEPLVVTEQRRLALIPHYRTQEEFDAAIRLVMADNSPPTCLFVHQTFEGAIAETGVRLSGLSAAGVEPLGLPLGVYAGDVHRPQTQGDVTYVGCPYQVRFGDNFEPRCIRLSRTGVESHPWFDAPRKWSLKIRDSYDIETNANLYDGDQVKLTVEVPREEVVEWKTTKQRILTACKVKGLEVHGIALEAKGVTQTKGGVGKKLGRTTDIFDAFCTHENVGSSIRKKGRDILNGN